MAKVEKSSDRRPEKATKKTEFTAVFLPERDTKGAWKFNEVDDDDEQYDLADSQIGPLYIRKTALKEDKRPKRVTIQVIVEY